MRKKLKSWDDFESWNPKSDEEFRKFKKSHLLKQKENLVELLYWSLQINDDLTNKLESLSSQVIRFREKFDDMKFSHLPMKYVVKFGKNVAELSAKEARTNVAKKAGLAKAAKNIAHSRKAAIHEMWLEWQSGTKLYKSGADFVRKAGSMHPEIQSIKTIEKWLREWKASK